LVGYAEELPCNGNNFIHTNKIYIMIDYEKVFKTIAYLIETMNNFDDEVLRYKYSKVLLHYKNYIENCIGENDIRGELKALLYIRRNAEKHLNYIYFPHLNGYPMI
jgi:hypothetical protein